MGTILRLKDKATFSTGSKVIKAEDYSTLLESRQIIEDAQKKAAAIISKAENQAEDELDKARKQGLEQGRKEIESQKEELTEKAISFMKCLDHAVADLVLEAVRKIMGEMNDTELVVKIIRRTLREMNVRKMLTIKVPMGEEDSIRGQLSDIADNYPGLEIFSVVGDPHLQGADCIMESDMGTLEAGVETQLNHIRKAFDACLNNCKS